MQKLKTYPSGLRVVCEYMPDRKVESVSFFVASGSGYDLKNKEGIAHFYEHMFFKSTKNRSAFKVNLDLDSLGAGGNAFTSFSRTAYYSLVRTEDTEKLFDILSDCFFNGLFLDEEIKTEQGVVCSEIDRYQDSFFSCANDAYIQKMYAGSNFSHPVLGSKESVMSITADDLREYRQKNNDPSRLVITVAGGVPFEKIEELVEKYVLPYTETHKNESVVLYKDKAKDIILKDNYIFTSKDTKQVYFLFGIPTVRLDSPDFRKLDFASIIFGGPMSSRLFQRLREKEGCVYTVRSDIDSLPLTGDFNVYFATNKETATQAVSSFKDELDKVVSDGFTEEEIERTKELIRANMAIKLDSVVSIGASNAMELINFNKPYNSEEKLKEMLSLTCEEINEFAKRVLSSKNFLVSIVAKEDDIDFISMLK